jgi:hypothetical protein
MFSDVHTVFILTPLTEVLADGINACTPLPVGVENSAFGEYFMQSLFLRMTGAQEQKLKCICWVMATNDYKYRYDLLNVKQYGECSEYKHKKEIYKDMTSLIQGLDRKFNPLDVLADIALSEDRLADIERVWKNKVDDNRRKQVEHIIAVQTAQGGALNDAAKDKIKNNIMGKPYPQNDWEGHLFKEKKTQFIKDIVTELIDMLKGSPLTTWNYREFLFFKEHWMDVLNSRQLNLTSNEFLGARLQGYYQQLVFEHRNKTAHNTVSYMKDIPSLDTLADKGYVYKNYFFRFAILILIDEVFMRMFRKYRELGIGGF